MQSCGALNVVRLLFEDYPSDLSALPERHIKGLKESGGLRMGVYLFASDDSLSTIMDVVAKYPLNLLSHSLSFTTTHSGFKHATAGLMSASSRAFASIKLRSKLIMRERTTFFICITATC